MNKYLTNPPTHFASCRISTPNKTLKQVQGDELQSGCNKPKHPQPAIASASEAIRKKESCMQTKKAFTLAEIMIVLMVIGILTAILLPSARNAMPNEDILKFKKAHNTLFTIFRELTNSDKYFLDGDLGVRSNGDLIDGTHGGDLSYLCEAIADNLNLKENNCKKIYDFYTTASSSSSNICNGNLPICENGQACNSIYEKFDYSCKKLNGRKHKYSIATQGGALIYQSSPFSVFGIKSTTGERLYESGKDSNSFYCYVNTICIDIDGVPENATNTDCVNECPFGYGLRVDGKLIPGTRAQQWLEKSIQEK